MVEQKRQSILKVVTGVEWEATRLVKGIVEKAVEYAELFEVGRHLEEWYGESEGGAPLAPPSDNNVVGKARNRREVLHKGKSTGEV